MELAWGRYAHSAFPAALPVGLSHRLRMNRVSGCGTLHTVLRHLVIGVGVKGTQWHDYERVSNYK